jgi:hypothetical protein
MSRVVRGLTGAAIAVGALGAWACGEATKPLPQVASVVVTSPIGARLAVGRTAQLVAVAHDGSGAALPSVAFSWTSSAPSVAEVSSSGLVTGRAEGTATIAAQAQGISGRFGEQVLAADIAGARALLTDPFASSLVAGLTGTLKGQLQGAVAQCVTGLDSGNFDTMDGAMTTARAGVAGASDPSDKALTATFALFVDQASRLLRL